MCKRLINYIYLLPALNYGSHWLIRICNLRDIQPNWRLSEATTVEARVVYINRPWPAHVTWSRKTLFWNELSNIYSDESCFGYWSNQSWKSRDKCASSQMHVKKLSEWKKLLEGWLGHAKIKAFERGRRRFPAQISQNVGLKLMDHLGLDGCTLIANFVGHRVLDLAEWKWQL